MTRPTLLASSVAALALGAVVAGLALSQGAATNPDGGPALVGWAAMAPDASQQVTCFVGPTALSSYCVYVSNAGYQEFSVMQLAAGDSGLVLGVPRPHSCGCAAIDAGPCLWADGGQVPLTGTYDWAIMSGPGCLRRACRELSSSPAGENTAAPAGCQP